MQFNNFINIVFVFYSVSTESILYNKSREKYIPLSMDNISVVPFSQERGIADILFCSTVDWRVQI